MKTLTRLTLISACCIAALNLTACGSSDNKKSDKKTDPSSSSMTGLWKDVQSQTYLQVDSQNNLFDYSYEEDEGCYDITEYKLDNNGSYQLIDRYDTIIGSVKQTMTIENQQLKVAVQSFTLGDAPQATSTDYYGKSEATLSSLTPVCEIDTMQPMPNISGVWGEFPQYPDPAADYVINTILVIDDNQQITDYSFDDEAQCFERTEFHWTEVDFNLMTRVSGDIQLRQRFLTSEEGGLLLITDQYTIAGNNQLGAYNARDHYITLDRDPSELVPLCAE